MRAAGASSGAPVTASRADVPFDRPVAVRSRVAHLEWKQPVTSRKITGGLDALSPVAGAWHIAPREGCGQAASELRGTAVHVVIVNVQYHNLKDIDVLCTMRDAQGLQLAKASVHMATTALSDIVSGSSSCLPGSQAGERFRLSYGIREIGSVRPLLGMIPIQSRGRRIRAVESRPEATARDEFDLD